MASADVSRKSGDKNPNWRGGFTSTCAQCGSGLWVKPSCAARVRHFCSKPCSHSWHSANIRGEKASSWKGGELEHSCSVCGISFRALPSKRRIYCSKACGAVGRVSKITKACEVCGDQIEVQKHRSNARFCSIACKSKSQDSGLSRAHRLLDRRMTGSIWAALRSRKAGRSWESLVGYTLDDLAAHLERQFASGMSWDNIGEWHVDHVRPRSAFSYSSPDDAAFKECWALPNLQPLWAIENMSKGARLDWSRHGAGMSPRPA